MSQLWNNWAAWSSNHPYYIFFIFISKVNSFSLSRDPYILRCVIATARISKQVDEFAQTNNTIYHWNRFSLWHRTGSSGHFFYYFKPEKNSRDCFPLTARIPKRKTLLFDSHWVSKTLCSSSCNWSCTWLKKIRNPCLANWWFVWVEEDNDSTVLFLSIIKHSLC